MLWEGEAGTALRHGGDTQPGGSSPFAPWGSNGTLLCPSAVQSPPALCSDTRAGTSSAQQPRGRIPLGAHVAAAKGPSSSSSAPAAQCEADGGTEVRTPSLRAVLMAPAPHPLAGLCSTEPGAGSLWASHSWFSPVPEAELTLHPSGCQHSPSFSSQPSRSGLKKVWVRSLPSSSGILKGSFLMLS